jgi:hypothetical protein
VVGYVAATAYLATRGRAPARLITFLDDAHRLGLLRTIGPLYQFRHAEPQDHLAAPHRPAPTPPTPLPPARATKAEPRRSTTSADFTASAAVGATIGVGALLVFDRPATTTEIVVYAAVTVAGLVVSVFAIRAHLRRR